MYIIARAQHYRRRQWSYLKCGPPTRVPLSIPDTPLGNTQTGNLAMWTYLTVYLCTATFTRVYGHCGANTRPISSRKQRNPQWANRLMAHGVTFGSRSDWATSQPIIHGCWPAVSKECNQAYALFQYLAPVAETFSFSRLRNNRQLCSPRRFANVVASAAAFVLMQLVPPSNCVPISLHIVPP